MEEERLELKEDARPQKNKLLIVFFILTPLLLGFLIVLVLMLYSGGGSGLFNDPVQMAQPRFVESMGDYQVNLSDSGGRRYLRVNFEVGFNENRLQKELEQRGMELRSEVIALLRSKTVEDLQEPGGQSALREEIVALMNEMLVAGEIRALYYTEFIIQ